MYLSARNILQEFRGFLQKHLDIVATAAIILLYFFFFDDRTSEFPLLTVLGVTVGCVAGHFGMKYVVDSIKNRD